MVDSTLAFDIFARDDGASAVFDKVARAADKTGASLRKTGKISDDVAKSSTNLTSARNRETDALDKVQVAEARLADVRGNSKSKTGQIVAAEKALSKARRDAAVAGNVAQKAAKDLGQALDNEGKKAGKGLGSSLRKWFTGDGKNVFKQIGEDGSSVFGSGFLGALKTPILGPAIVATIGAAVATVMPAIGAVAAGGLVTAFGAGLAGLGIVFATKSVAVKNAWKRTLASMGADMKTLSKPFEKTLIDMAGVAQRTFGKFTIPLQDAFRRIAPALSEFGSDLGKAFEGLVPVIAPLSAAFTEVLKSLGPAMQTAVSSFADGLTRISNSVKQNPNGLPDLVKGLGSLFKTLSDGIGTLNDINGMFEKFTGGFSLVDGVFSQLNLAVGTLFGPFDLLAAGMKKITGNAKDMNGAVAISADTAKLWTQGLSAAQVAAAGTGSALDPLPAKVESLAAKFDRQWAATQKANDALTRMSGLLLTLSGSEIAYQQALDDATASIKENGKTHDINTAKGRANKTALDQVSASANAQTIAMRNSGDGNVAAAKHGEAARASFVKLATQMGYTVPQAKAMAKSMIAIPNVSRTAKLNANIKDLESKLKTAKGHLADKNLTKERKAKLNADIAKLEAGIARAKQALGSLPKSRSVSITTTYTEVHRVVGAGSRSSSGGVGGGHQIAGRAIGGPVKAGVPYVVGEHGPEVVVPTQSAVVIPNGATSRGTAVAGGQTRVVLEVRSGGSRMDDFLVDLIRKYVRVNGGSVQAVLGR